MGGKAKGVGKRGIGSSKSRKTHKQGLRAQFESRHLDQIWEDVRKAVTVHDGKTAPVGTTDRYASLAGCALLKHILCYCCQPISENCLYICRAQLDEDLPAHGQHYCIPCRYLLIPDVCLSACYPPIIICCFSLQSLFCLGERALGTREDKASQAKVRVDITHIFMCNVWSISSLKGVHESLLTGLLCL